MLWEVDIYPRPGQPNLALAVFRRSIVRLLLRDFSGGWDDYEARLNVSVNDLAMAAVRDLIARPDEEFERAAARVLEKNRELYRRLA